MLLLTVDLMKVYFILIPVNMFCHLISTVILLQLKSFGLSPIAS